MIAKSFHQSMGHQSAGCGCGGGASTSVASCGCGGGGCASCLGQGLVRPKFFAGQLLTEDDLQLLGDYIVQKNRLHNRALAGAGVVCGLEVSCHPCGDGRVIVHPGYALDCCGNDLVLSCAQTLDINAMIRDLRRDQLGGFDCTDPCPDPPKSAADCDKKDGKDNGASRIVNPGAPGQPATPAAIEKTTRTYCLYLRYCEQDSDPVMPYSTGDDCGRASCQTTRVREGVKFELRCKPLVGEANPMLARLCACFGDLGVAARIISLAFSLRRSIGSLSAVIKSISNNVGIAATDDDAKALLKGTELLRLETDALSNRGGAGLPVSEVSIPPSFTNAAANLASLVARFELLDPDNKNRPVQDIGSAKLMLAHAGRTVQPILEKMSPDAERESIWAIFEVADKIGVPEWRDATLLMAHRVAFTPAIQATATGMLAQIRDWLLERLERAPFITDCSLRPQVMAVTLPAPQSRDSKTSLADARITATAERALVDALIRYLRDCVCRALNPPCQPCDDTAVLLACLEVKDCGVASVCNLERSFVLSPAAVRYWLPPLQLAGQFIERLCCQPLDALRQQREGQGERGLDFSRILTEEVEQMVRNSMCSPEGRLSDATDLASVLFNIFSGRQTKVLNRESVETIGMFENSPSAAPAQPDVPAADEAEAAISALNSQVEELRARIAELTEKQAFRLGEIEKAALAPAPDPATPIAEEARAEVNRLRTEIEGFDARFNAVIEQMVEKKAKELLESRNQPPQASEEASAPEAAATETAGGAARTSFQLHVEEKRARKQRGKRTEGNKP